MPHSEVDGRIFKLVVRMLQKASIDAGELWFHARRGASELIVSCTGW